MSTRLDYESEAFPRTVREYALDRRDFWFEISGPAREELLPFLSPSLFANLAPMGLKRKLGRLQATLGMCLGQNMHYAVDVTPESVRVRFSSEPLPD